MCQKTETGQIFLYPAQKSCKNTYPQQKDVKLVYNLMNPVSSSQFRTMITSGETKNSAGYSPYFLLLI